MNAAKQENSSAAVAAPLDQGQALTLAEIQKQLNALSLAMTAKGLRAPTAELTIKAHAVSRSYVHLGWPATKGSDHYKFFYGAPDKAFAEAAAFIAALPTPEQARLNAFRDALGEAIELGKKADIGVEYVNPLLALMKQLSKNALEHQVPA